MHYLRISTISGLFTFLLITAGQLNVMVAVNPPGVTQQTSSTINLTCVVSGMPSLPLTYQWTSTCSGNCFVLLGATQTITQPSLHSVDSGNHTCSVTDALGNSGTATAEVIVTGSLVICNK